MKLRKELELQSVADNYIKLYRKVYSIIENSDNEKELDKIIKAIYELTGKIYAKEKFIKYWKIFNPHEMSYCEHYYFLTKEICYPEPKIVDNITKNELREIVERIRNPQLLKKYLDEEAFQIAHVVLLQYYHDLLKLNFIKYKREYFDEVIYEKNGMFYVNNIGKIVELLWDNN